MVKKIYLASDHGGYDLKEEIKMYLQKQETEVVDVGNKIKDENDDYPDFIIPLAKQVAQEQDSIGIIFGRSGNGEAIAANKVSGARAALCLDKEMAEKARNDNYANILSLGADFVSTDEAINIVNIFLTTDYSKEERHKRRVQKISDYETAHTG
jgi:ribose 5-phosphate isomerase B